MINRIQHIPLWLNYSRWWVIDVKNATTSDNFLIRQSVNIQNPWCTIMMMPVDEDQFIGQSILPLSSSLI